MAKNRTKPSKKGKKQKHAQQSRPESKLRHYWQEGKWDGFVALYLRRHAESLPQDLHDRWGNAVFNLLVQTLFVDRTPDMVPSLLEMLRPGPPLPEDVRGCLDLTTLFHRSLDADVSPAELEAISADLPPPFDALRTAMREAQDAAHREHAGQGLPKRATDPGDKALKGFVQSCEKLRQAGFRPKTISAYNTLEKHAGALTERFSGEGAKKVASDLHILVQVCKRLYEIQRKGDSTTAADILRWLARSRFSFTDHPALHSLVRMLLDQAGMLFSSGIRAELQRSLLLLYPSRHDPGVRADARFQAVRAAFHAYITARDQPREFILHQACVSLLREDLWSARERYVLMALGIMALALLAMTTARTLPFEPDDDVMNQVPTNMAVWLLEMADIQDRLGIQARGLPFSLWDKVMACAPHPFLARQLRYLREVPELPRFPDINLLRLAELAELVLTANQARAFIEKMVGNRDNRSLALSEKDCALLVGNLDFTGAPAETLEAWRPHLDASSWSRLLDSAAAATVEHVLRVESGNPFLHLFWARVVDDDLPRYMAEHLPETAPLAGFFRMTSLTGLYVLPRNAKHAALFFAGFPPPDQAVKLFFWMVSWQGGSAASKSFLLEFVTRISEELLRRNQWLRAVTELRDTGRLRLFDDLLARWGERGWVDEPPTTDFKNALELVQNLLRPKPTPKKKRQTAQRKKQRSLF